MKGRLLCSVVSQSTIGHVPVAWNVPLDLVPSVLLHLVSVPDHRDVVVLHSAQAFYPAALVLILVQPTRLAENLIRPDFVSDTGSDFGFGFGFVIGSEP